MYRNKLNITHNIKYTFIRKGDDSKSGSGDLQFCTQ